MTPSCWTAYRTSSDTKGWLSSYYPVLQLFTGSRGVKTEHSNACGRTPPSSKDPAECATCFCHKQVYRILQAAPLLVLGGLGRANEASRHLGRATSGERPRSPTPFHKLRDLAAAVVAAVGM